jgi:hypothetical protein
VRRYKTQSIMAVGVFISYNHEDLRIARVLEQCLLALSPELNVFIDHAGLEAGDDYEDKLSRSISESQWFVILCSGPPRPERDMSWCLYEAGQFRMRLLGESGDKPIRKRIVSIHDDERPRPLSHYQSVRIRSQDRLGRPLDLSQTAEDTSSFENTEAFSFFENLIQLSGTQPLRDLADQNVRSLLRENARRLIRAFVDMQSEAKLPEIVLQPRISFRLPSTIDSTPVKLSPNTKVLGYEASLSILFGIAGTESTWGAIKARCREQDDSDPLWIGDVEIAAEQVSQNLVPDQPTGLCLAKTDRKIYRVLMARFEPFRSGARVCYVVFIPSRPRSFDVRQRTSIFLSALILSIRFRQKILPFIKTIQDLRKNNKLDGLLRLERELHEIETESQEFGLHLPEDEEDDPPLVREFREGENKLFVQKSIQSWSISRRVLTEVFTRVREPDPNVGRIDAAIEGSDVVVNELQKFQEVNGRFIQVLTEELLFTEKVAATAREAGA